MDAGFDGYQGGGFGSRRELTSCVRGEDGGLTLVSEALEPCPLFDFVPRLSADSLSRKLTNGPSG